LAVHTLTFAVFDVKRVSKTYDSKFDSGHATVYLNYPLKTT